MISKAAYDDISRRWDGEIFQTWERMKKRLPLFEKKVLPHLAGKRVLEIGSNAGIYAWHIAPVAKSYVGVEINETFVKQAEITKQSIRGAPASFQLSALSDFDLDKVQFDAVLASYVLYHLDDGEIEIFEKKIMPRCDVVSVQIRAHKRRTANTSHFMKAANIKSLFNRAGFNCKFHWANWRRTAFAAVGMRNGHA